ncbi:MAG: YebC/PmpR family DNA-binding transcriptional regulator [Cyclobacteriaceae bacterium]|nr:YebC/PmpR family DNA-binding transcriptional regulator [Cyclobacteriaceae bacterium]
MSGHSKWANIKHRKGAKDAKKGKIFTKLIKEISVAARVGGADIDSNARLRLAVQNAKGQNMPKENIERAIKKATGADAEDYTEITYEGYGPNGVAVFVECMTDNLNRTVSVVRSLFSKHGGSLGTNGSVEYMFEHKGIFNIELEGKFDEDELTLELIDGGAEEVEFEEGYLSVVCAKEDFGNMQKKIEALGLKPENSELQRIPTTTVSLDNEAFAKVMKLIDAFEDDDDVQKVYHNIEATDSQMHMM